MIRVIHHSSKFTVLIVKKKIFKKSQQAKQTHNLLVSIVVFVCESYLFCDSVYMLNKGESQSTTSCVVLSMSTMNTSNFKYEQYEYDMKISMNACKYHIQGPVFFFFFLIFFQISFFYLKVQSIQLIMENSFIQIAASADHAVSHLHDRSNS